MQQPNIVFIQCDSMDGRAMGCMAGNMSLPPMPCATPNLDRLARRGALFTDAYCHNPVCVPSRASMWSGQYTHHCEAWNNDKGLDDDAPTFLTRFEASPYRTAVFGRTDHLSGRHTIRARVSAWTRSAGIHRPNYNEPSPRVLDSMETRVNGRDWATVDESVAWIRNTAAAGDRPFFLYVGFNAPHPSFVTSRHYLNLINEQGITVPPPDEQDHPVTAYQRAVKNWSHDFSEEMVRTVRRVYLGMVAEVDAMVGAIVRALEETGLDGSTYILFTSDHGELAMEHRQFYKMSLYEPSVRVPLIVTGPGIAAGRRVAKPASLIDLYPTLMDMGGLPHPEGLDGHSLLPELTGGASERPDWVLAQCHDSCCNTGSFMLRRRAWKYIAFVGYSPQLFNLEKDPWEVKNLAADRPDVVAEMDALLRELVDYKAVDAQVKAYDRASFRRWRAEELERGTYREHMACVFAGWDHITSAPPWTDEDEQLIRRWLE